MRNVRGGITKSKFTTNNIKSEVERSPKHILNNVQQNDIFSAASQSKTPNQTKQSIRKSKISVDI